VLYAAMQVGSGAARLVVAGGVESMSQAEHYVLGLRRGVRGDGVELMDRLARARVTAGGRLHPLQGGMVETAENLRRRTRTCSHPAGFVCSDDVRESLQV
jgi:acetyl-CoA C-acetyltransferase